jgi:hypothetical protein
MHLLARISFILLISGFVVCEEEVKSDEGVLVLTVKNFKQAIKDNEHLLVEFCKYQFQLLASLLLFNSKIGYRFVSPFCCENIRCEKSGYVDIPLVFDFFSYPELVFFSVNF